MPLRRVGRPGLLGLAARTAVVAGTAQAISSRVTNNNQRKAQGQYEQEQYALAREQAQLPEQQPAPAPPAPSSTDVLTQIQKLADLKQAGLLTDQEFTNAKAKLLG